MVLCFLHGFLKIRDRCRKARELHRRVWDVYRAATAEEFRRLMNEFQSSNSRPSECDSSWFAHFDSDKMMRHHRDVEKDLRYGLLEPEPARFWRSSACFGS